MKSLIAALLVGLGALATSACIVAPAPVRGAPPGVAYVAPTYAMPGPGYVWEYHPQYGWGWHHPELGWHQGWR